MRSVATFVKVEWRQGISCQCGVSKGSVERYLYESGYMHRYKMKTVGLWPTADTETKKKLAKGKLAGKNIRIFVYFSQMDIETKKKRI